MYFTDLLTVLREKQLLDAYGRVIHVVKSRADFTELREFVRLSISTSSEIKYTDKASTHYPLTAN